MTAAAAKERPPSPPTSNDGDFGLAESIEFASLQELQQHASGGSRYMPRSSRSAPVNEHELDQYGDPTLYQTAPAHGYYTPQPTFHRTTNLDTPPNTGYDAAGIRTRSGRALGSPLDPDYPALVRRTRSPRPKKAPRAPKEGKAKGPVIDQPLSVITRDYTIPVKDMEAWVNRSVETRMKEVERKDGYVARPMNSFMLYRSAFADRVKHFCKENNHQVVSQVSGASWGMEPKEVKDRYEQYALTEKENHSMAHPDYKFAPNKNGIDKKRRFEASDDEGSEWGTPSRGNKRGRVDGSRSHSSTPFEMGRAPVHPLAHLEAYHPSSYHRNNPHGIAPVMRQPDAQVGYWESTTVPYSQQVEDIQYRYVQGPVPQPRVSRPLVGLPGSNYQDLLQPQSRVMNPTPVQGQLLDPRLLQFDPNIQYDYEQLDPRYAGQLAYEHETTHAAPSGFGYAVETNSHPGMVTLTNDQQWFYSQEQAGSEFDDELLKLES